MLLGPVRLVDVCHAIVLYNRFQHALLALFMHDCMTNLTETRSASDRYARAESGKSAQGMTNGDSADLVAKKQARQAAAKTAYEAWMIDFAADIKAGRMPKHFEGKAGLAYIPRGCSL